MKFIIGVIITVMAVAMVIKSESFLRFFGRISFFEKHLGTEGGSRLGYKIIGLIFIFLGMLTMTGMIDGFMGWILGPILRLKSF
ncbi:hypothetical protein K8R62_00690 [bacterium]|nr:hypothetical protein [bacterium]